MCLDVPPKFNMEPKKNGWFPSSESLIPGCQFSGSMFDFWGGYLHAHLSSISVGLYPPGDSKAACVSWPWEKDAFPKSVWKKFRNSIHFSAPSKKNWSRFEIPKLFTRSSALRSSISLVLVSSQSWNSPRKKVNECMWKHLHVYDIQCTMPTIYDWELICIAQKMQST